MVDTRKKQVPTPGAPRSAAPAGKGPSTKPVTQEQISISLEAIVEELANHVPAEKRPQVEILRRLAVEKPDEHAKVKEQMLLVAGAEALRNAISALVNGRKPSPAVEGPGAPASAAQQGASACAGVNAMAPAPAAYPTCPVVNEPAMPPNLPAIFGSTASTPMELQDFKAQLLHAFHCRTPSCPVAGCAQLAPKLQRLQTHVTSCNLGQEGGSCLLCSIWRYMREYQAAVASTNAEGGAAQAMAPALAGSGVTCGSCDTIEGLGSVRGMLSSMGGVLGGALGAAGMGLSGKMFQNDLLQSHHPLPVWDRETGKLSWMSSQDALTSVRNLCGLDGRGSGGTGRSMDGQEAAGGGSHAKRQKSGAASSSGSVLSALSAYPGVHQGVLQTPLWALPNTYGVDIGGSASAGAAPRVASAAPAPAPRTLAPSGGGSGGRGASMPPRGGRVGESPGHLPMGMSGHCDNLDLAQLAEDMGAGSKMSHRRPAAAGRGTKRGAPAGGFPGGVNPFSPLQMESTRSFNLSGIIRDTSLSELGFNGCFSGLDGFGLSFNAGRGEMKIPSEYRITGSGLSKSDLTSDFNPPTMSSDLKLTSELKEVNASEISISGLLNESATDIVSGLAQKTSEYFGLSKPKEEQVIAQQDQLRDIMQDLGAPRMPTTVA